MSAGHHVVNDNYSSPQCQLELTVTPAYLCLGFIVSFTVPNPLASPFGGAESLAPPGAKGVAEPKGLGARRVNCCHPFLSQALAGSRR